MLHETLRRMALFTDLDDASLELVAARLEEARLESGQELFKEGSPGGRAYFIVEGELEVLKQSGGRQVLLAVRRAGEIVGEMALLQDLPRMATVRAAGDTVVLVMNRVNFDRLLDEHPQVLRTMLYTALDRAQKTEAMLRHSERMAQLGTLAAGMAHELNNPAAAMQSCLRQLRSSLLRQAAAQAELARRAPPPVVLDLLASVVDGPGQEAQGLDPLSRSARESELAARLAGWEVADAWELAGPLVEAGWRVQDLERLAAELPDRPSYLEPLLQLTVAGHEVTSLLVALEEGAARIAAIVGALKAYSYLDQAPVQRIDVGQSLEDTLRVLAGRLEGIDVQREYAPALPPLEGYGRELNQVWTHLITNAADALNGVGTEAAGAQGDRRLTVRAGPDGDDLVVEIEDNGTGIPEANLSRIFDPFFTTKPPGQGAGLGLEVCWNIVTNRHGGELTVTSGGGRTCFAVRLPLAGVRESSR